MNEWVTLLIGLVAGAGVLYLGIRFFPSLATKEQGYPMEKQIEDALLPHIFNAISSGYRLSEQAMDDIRVRIRGADKARIAKEVYALLPQKIGNFDISFVKQVIGEEKFAQMVQQAFNHFDEFYGEHQDRFDELYEEWKAENAPPGV